MHNIIRRWVVVVAVLILLLATAACGSGDKESAASEPTSPPAESPTEAPTPEPEPTSTEPVPTDTPESEQSTEESAEEPASEDTAEEAAEQEPAETESLPTAQAEAYPAPAEEEAESAPAPSEAYPAPAEPTLAPDGYPAPQADAPTDYVEGPKFTIITPVIEGSAIVSGTGPADVPIMLVNVSEMGAVLADTVIGEDGSFEFELTNPLPAGNSIGLKIGDLDGTPFNADDYRFSPNYYERPFVGTLLDLVSTQPAE